MDTHMHDRALCAKVVSKIRDITLAETYDRYFAVEQADTTELVEECFGIRYKVYCIEHPYEDKTARNGDSGSESDVYDAHSKHALLRYRPTDAAVGTVRMVYPQRDVPDSSFALQTLVDWQELREADFYPVGSTGEISRFCVTRDFRRRLHDHETEPFPASNPPIADELRRVIPNMTLGLIEWLVRISIRDGLTHWCAVMEPSLLRLLARLGIHFDHIGGLVEFHGLRQPCVTELIPMLARLKQERPDVWSVVTAKGCHA